MAKSRPTIVRTERYLAARIGGNGAESEVGITIGQALTGNRIPEKHAWFGTFLRVLFWPKAGKRQHLV